MDWNLFRRTTLVLFLTCCSIFSVMGEISESLESRQSIHGNWNEYKTQFIQAKQGHAGEKSWSEGIERALEMRPEIAYWIKNWLSEEGREKIRLSRKRMFPYRSEVDSILRKAHIPWEFSSVPIVESNWKIDAVSSSGAVGPWQFIEKSGRGRHLVIDSWRDERRNVWRSTEAAVEEISFSYGVLKTWILTMAAYNAGPTRMRTLKTEHGFSDFWQMLDAGIIPSETESYVPQVIAVSYIQMHAGRLGIPIEWNAPEQWESVSLNRSLHLREIAQKTGMKEDMLIQYNPDLNQPITPPSENAYLLRIPGNVENIEEIKDILLTRNDEPERFWRYTVRHGDTFSGIAKTFGIPVKEILRYNASTEPNFLHIGERLFLPGTHQQPPLVDGDELPNWSGRYTVKPGDSLWSIAMKYEVTPATLAEMNYRPVRGTLNSGSVLRVPE